MKDINRINQVIEEYFKLHSGTNKVPAKDLMPEFIRAGIFKQDDKNGLPIRKILRELDASNQLSQIPYVFPERNTANTNWFFIRDASTNRPALDRTVQTINQTPKVSVNETNSGKDEAYVIGLCDEVLGRQGSRQHRFDFLLGDEGTDGRRVKLPCDVYYSDLNLVVEYKEVQHTSPVAHFDKPDVMTVSGVHRGEQRRIYDERRAEVLPQHGIELVGIPYSVFNCSNSNRIIRNVEADKKVVENYLKKYLSK